MPKSDYTAFLRSRPFLCHGISLIVHLSENGRVVTLGYSVHGKVRRYDEAF